MKRLAFGFKTFFSGLRLWVKTRHLLAISAIPLILDLVLLVSGMYYVVLEVPELAGKIVGQPTHIYQYIAYYFTAAVTALGLFLVAIFAVYVVAGLLTFPFNDILAERTLRLKGAAHGDRLGFKVWFSRSVKNAGAMFRRTLILLVVGGFLFLATLIPGVAMAAGLISAFILATERVDYSFDQYGWTFKQRVSFIKSNLPETFGFAAALGLTSLIPVINILIMPGSVVSGAVLVSELKNKRAGS